MRRTTRLYLVGIFVSFTAVASPSFATGDLTFEQLADLTKASAGRYISIDSRMVATSYKNKTDEAAQGEIQMVREITHRSSAERGKSCWRIETTYYQSAESGKPAERKTVTTYAVTPQYVKRLDETPNGIPRATIRPGGITDLDQDFLTVCLAMWYRCDLLWEKRDLHKTSVDYDPASGTYILEAQFLSDRGPIWRFWLDPTKDFIATRREFLSKDGTLFNRFWCEDFRKVNGLWVPYRYSWFDPSAKYGVVYEVQEVTVNEPVSDELLDFEFPQGTIVRDERIASKYVVGRAESERRPTSTTSGTVGTPATDEELAAAAAKAAELLREQSPAQSQPPQIKVLPEMVLVESGESTYSLLVIAYSSQSPELRGFTFDSEGLVLVSLKDTISTQGKAVVEIQRQQSATGFVRGVLSLEFAEAQVEVPFVGPPLSETP